MIKVAVIASTSGSVLKSVLTVPYVRDRVSLVLSDRICGAVEVGNNACVPVTVYQTRSGIEFSDWLIDFFTRNSFDLVFSFYTKLFKPELVKLLYGRFINFHPSILPACPGKDGFGDTIKSGAKFIGATAHLIDDGIDTGYPLIQSATPFNENIDLAKNRHAVFRSQCKMFIQLINWYEGGAVRILDNGRPTIIGGQYQVSEFSPNLDFDLAKNVIV